MTPLRLVLLVIMAARPTFAAIANRTIDDTRGDSVTANPVVYQGVWSSNACPQCLIQPDPAQAFDGTWTGTTYFQQSQDPINATLTFTGTAIYIFFILVNNLGTGVVSKTMVNITLDNQPPVPFEHIPSISSSNLQYNSLVFSRVNLENIHHSVVISVFDIQEEVYVNFDYAIYTHEDQIVGASGDPDINPAHQSQIPTSSQIKIPHASPISFSIMTPATEKIPTALTTHTSLIVPIVSAPNFRPESAAFSIPTPESSLFLIPPSSVTNVGTSSQTSNGLSPSQHTNANLPVGAIVGGSVGGLVVLSLLVFGLVFIRSKRRYRPWDSSRGSANLLDDEDGGSGRYIYTGSGNIDEDGANARILPFPLGTPDSRDSMPSVTLASQMTPHNETDVVRVNSTQRIENLRRARQEELDHRLREMQQEMIEVPDETNNRRGNQQMFPAPSLEPGQQNLPETRRSHGSASTEGQMPVDELQETLRHMRQQIDHLQQQQQSAWAQGLSDDLPPGYTTEIPS